MNKRNKYYTRALDLIKQSIDNFNSSILNGDEYEEIDYNYRYLQVRLHDFIHIFFNLSHPNRHYSEGYTSVLGKNVLKEITIINDNNKELAKIIGYKE